MSGFEIAGGIVLLLVSLLITITVISQEAPKNGGINALSGGDSYYNKNQGRTRDAMLVRLTKILAVAFFVVAIGAYAVEVYL